MNDFFYFWICWLVLGLCSFLFFRFNKNAGLKRFIFPFFLTSINFIFLYFVWTVMKVDGPFLYIFTFGVVAVAIVNYRKTRFCNTCGATVYSGSLIAPPSVCAKYDTRLE